MAELGGGGALPLFPWRMVLFPGALLPLKIFEARYLDMVAACMRTQQAFGVVCLTAGGEADRGAKAQMADIGVRAHIDDVDAEQAGILILRASGGDRFRLVSAPVQQPDGLWVANGVEPIAPDTPQSPAPAVSASVHALAEAIRKLHAQGRQPFAKPYRLDDAGWVANRWCELLPVSLAAKQKLMALEDPAMRLSLVHDFLRDQQVLGD